MATEMEAGVAIWENSWNNQEDHGSSFLKVWYRVCQTDLKVILLKSQAWVWGLGIRA